MKSSQVAVLAVQKLNKHLPTEMKEATRIFHQTALLNTAREKFNRCNLEPANMRDVLVLPELKMFQLIFNFTVTLKLKTRKLQLFIEFLRKP